MKAFAKVKVLGMLLCMMPLAAYAAGIGQPVRPSPAANGVWSGTFTERGRTFDLSAFVYNGRIIGISEAAGVVYSGRYALNGRRLRGGVTGIKIGGTRFGTAAFSGTALSRRFISATYNGILGRGSFSLRYSPINNKRTFLSTLRGIWSVTEGAYTQTISISPNGFFTGSDTNGCVFNGKFSDVLSRTNLYTMAVSVSNCIPFPRRFTGLATLSNRVRPNDVLIFGATNPSAVVVGAFFRQ